MRHKLVHHYDDFDDVKVYKIVKKEIPVLRKQLENILRDCSLQGVNKMHLE